MNTGCFKCDKAQWDADGCTCKITGLLVGNAERGCEHRKDIEPKSCNPRNTKHGACKRNPTLYEVWKTMKHRCENKKRTKYKDYGARGIKVCADWQDPNAFIDWALANGYERGLQLDRINNDGNYCPENCRWITPKENSRNRRNTVLLTIGEETKCVSAWCEVKNVSQFTVYWWVKTNGKEYAERKLSEIA